MSGCPRVQSSAVRAVVLHGRDLGVVRERAQQLAAAVTERPDDPFDVAVLTEADLRGAELRGVELAGADLTRATLLRSTLQGTPLDGAVLGDTVMPDGTRRP